jgi:tetratricopeptide (TPR) repeat protein/tRNA A-37 threonylcarbamoyl transferase component Bud32
MDETLDRPGPAAPPQGAGNMNETLDRPAPVGAAGAPGVGERPPPDAGRTGHPAAPPTGKAVAAPPTADATLDRDDRRSPGTVLSAPTLPGSPTAGKARPAAVAGYEILGVLGRGGMGVVYKARHIKLNRLVALKMVLAGAHAAPQALQRFRTEAEAVAHLQHPNIVQIYEIGEQDGLPFFSLEYLDGGCLLDQLDGKPLPERKAAGLIEQLARAMHYAHAHGVVHRDLKPGNVLLAGDGTLKITDFGLAKRIDLDGAGGQTRTGAIMGTPYYMAPEQAAGRTRQIGPATDVYALGAMLYEMLTGRPPFRGVSAMDTVQQVLALEPVPPSRLRQRLPRDLETVCLKCLRKEPDKRYGSALELAEDLRHFQAGEPIRARPVGPWERAVKWARRRPAQAAVAGLMAVSFVLVTAGSLGLNAFYQRAERERLRREQAEAQEREHIRGLEGRGSDLIHRGQKALARQDFVEAQKQLLAAREALEGEEDLRNLWTTADQLYAQAGYELKALQEKTQARARYETFLKQQEEALFHGTGFIGVDVPADLAAAEEAARAALQAFGVTTDSKGPPRLGDFYTASEEDEITSGCYELLLVLAGTVAQPRPDQAPAAQQARLREALAVLDRATQLGLPATHTYHARRAEYLVRLGEAEAARREQRAADAVPPTTASDYFLLGAEAYDRRDLERAAVYFESALWRKPDHFWAEYFLALCRLKQNRPDEAEAHLTAALARRPKFVWLYLLRGYADGLLNKVSAAATDFRRALALDPPLYARYGVYVNRGAMYVERGKLDQGIADLKEAVALMPDQYQAHAHLATAYEKQKKWDDARSELDGAIRLWPNRAALHRQRGRLAVAQGDPDRALKDFDRAVALEPPGDPGLAEDHAERGRILQRRHLYDDAVRAYDLALEVRPDYALVHRFRAEALLELRRYEDALKAFDAYLRYEKGTVPADVYRGRGVTYAKLGRYAEAIADYSRALAQEPRSPGMRTRRGWAALMAASQMALADFDEAIKLNPKDGDSYNGRGYARVQLGQYRAAVADAETAVRLGPPAPEMSYNAACIYSQAVAQAQLDQKAADHETLAARYRDRAIELLGQALDMLPAAQRGLFWRQAVQPDVALNPVRYAPGFILLQEKYAPPASRRG